MVRRVDPGTPGGQKSLDVSRAVTPRAKIFKNRFRKQVMKIWFLKSMLLNGTPADAESMLFAMGPHRGRYMGPIGRGVWIGEVWWSEQNEEDTMLGNPAVEGQGTVICKDDI